MRYSSDDDEPNILSFQRPASKVNFLIRPNIGTIASRSSERQKLTPRLTFCSTFTETGIWVCHFSHVPSTRRVYFPAGRDESIASFDRSPSVQEPSLSVPL